MAGLGVWLTIVGFAIWGRDVFFFPLGIAYVSYGLIRSAVVAIGESGEGRPSAMEGGPIVLHDLDPAARQRRREPPDGGAF
jgi:hypothetical protein